MKAVNNLCKKIELWAYLGGNLSSPLRLSSLLDIIVSMSVLIGYSITTASFVLYVVKEHQNKAKQLQHISGLGVTSYWVTNFIYDLVSSRSPPRTAEEAHHKQHHSV